ncbi:MAG: hypothetical protein K9J17_08560 [Flavobacteriales bacterium]|nr:hypothetical protein [Flavobacteriales bacterium]
MDDYEEADSTAEYENELDEVEYAKGFNWGYVIGEHNPTLAQELMRDLEHDGGRGSGLIAGFRELFREKEQDRMTDLDSLRSRDQQKRDLER